MKGSWGKGSNSLKRQDPPIGHPLPHLPLRREAATRPTKRASRSRPPPTSLHPSRFAAHFRRPRNHLENMEPVARAPDIAIPPGAQPKSKVPRSTFSSRFSVLLTARVLVCIGLPRGSCPFRGGRMGQMRRSRQIQPYGSYSIPVFQDQEPNIDRMRRRQLVSCRFAVASSTVGSTNANNLQSAVVSRQRTSTLLPCGLRLRV